ncbi:MAG TPA: M50 family metallopeptidase [Ktedonobacteraceae bacterium]|nr:M50 family metallopeptidase [Ktedonobacteraceae bacterium]
MISTSTPAYADTMKPQLRAEIVFGPQVRNGGAIVYFMKDTFTNWFYKIGLKEHFLVSRMDGSRTLGEIGEEYVSQYGRYLDDNAWAGLFKLLEKRQMLVSTADNARLDELKEAAEKKMRADNKGFLRRRFRLVNPDAFLTKLLPCVQFAFRPAFVILTLVAIVALEVFVVLHVKAIGADAWGSRENILILPMFFGLVWFFTAFHEIAHGLTCKRFGGSVREIGITWRYLTFFPYCKLDDVVLFHNRRHQVYAAFAGTFISLLLLLPFSIGWWFAPTASAGRELCALFLIVFNISCFINFIPFIELDGYFMLSSALGMIDLRKESYRFWRKMLSKALFKKGLGIVAYEAHARYVYLVYGFVSLVFTICFLTATAFYWVTTLRLWLGDGIALGTLVLVALALLYSGPGKTWINNAMNMKRAHV